MQFQTVMTLSFGLGLIGQTVLVWLQLRAFRRYKHKSFALLALGTASFWFYSIGALLVVLEPWTIPWWSPRDAFIGVLMLSNIGVPLGIWGTAWLFQSYGDMQRRTGP